MTEQLKKCSKCGKQLPHSAFRTSIKRENRPGKGRRERLRVWTKCRDCERDDQREARRLRRPAEPDPTETFTTLPPVSERELFVVANAPCRGDHRFTMTGGPPALSNVRHDGGYRDRWTPLRELCATCPVLEDCRAVGDEVEGSLKTNGTDPAYIIGFRAGETPKQRITRRKEAALVRAA